MTNDQTVKTPNVWSLRKYQAFYVLNRIGAEMDLCYSVAASVQYLPSLGQWFLTGGSRALRGKRDIMYLY